ncbi:hypothetical protein OPV22_010875 [Ensete ventricosum]|uniref:B box-type domain-containing protein n=1 Tax=Ensete ventricosum TaxID=4639 RepID=A0AAV8RM78_ENSVE|nr:hypothetical protein OPV22_010875 [Ensete ventricosum]
MGPLCDFCGEQRPMVYCRSDAASLCLSCDRKCPFCKCPFLEALAKSFARQMQYATCDNLVHRRKCFSLSKLRSEWSWWFLISFRTQKADDKLLFSFEQGFGLINVNKNSVSSCLGPPENGCNIDIEGAGKIDELEAVDNHSSWIRSSSTSSVIPMRRTADQFAGSVDSTLTKLFCSGSKDVEFCKDDFYDDFMDDVDLTFGNYEELLGLSRDQSGRLFDDDGIDSFTNMKEKSVANSNCLGEFLSEVKPMHIACCNALEFCCNALQGEEKKSTSLTTNY